MTKKDIPHFAGKDVWLTHVMRSLVMAMLLLTGAQQVDGQKVFRLVDSLLSARYKRAAIDTNYVIRPKTKWTLLGRINMAGSTIKAEGTENEPFVSQMESDQKVTLSVGVSYLGVSLSFSLNPAKILGQYKDYEVGFRSYGKRFGFDIAYQDASNFKGWTEMNGGRQDFTTSEDMFNLQTLNVNAYYAFNHRRFSYPAAFSHTYIQRRSAGSFLLAVSGQGQHGEVKDEKEPVDFKMTNIGIGAGYGYNFVPGRGWLLHLSSLPTFIVYTRTSLTIGDTSHKLHYHFPEVIITGRWAVVKQIGSNKFASFSMVYNYTNIGHKDQLSIQNEKWLARLNFGFRL